MGITPNMTTLGGQMQMPLQVIFGVPLEPELEERTLSKYIAALQDGLRAGYKQPRAGLQCTAVHQRHKYVTVRCEDGNTRPGIWY